MKRLAVLLLLTACSVEVKNPSAGPIGPPGSNGHNAVFMLASADSSICSNGGTLLLVGLDRNDDGILQLDETTQSATICNGTNAPPTPYSPVGIVNPCGPSGGHDEVFLRLSNGMLLASFSDNANGNNTRFSLLSAGQYVTTDNDYCYFSVDANGNLFNEHH